MLPATSLTLNTQQRHFTHHLGLPFHSLTHNQYIHFHPKLELHAHISGSINETHLTELITQHWPDPTQQQEKLAICKLLPENLNDTRDLDECFALFKVLHHIIDSKEIIHMVTLQVLEDFIFRDNCCYIELRTTPRPIRNELNEIVVTSEEYIVTVCSALQEFRMIIAFLARKYRIVTVLDEFEIKIDHHADISKYSPYAQKIITKFDQFYCHLDLNNEIVANDDTDPQNRPKSPIEAHIVAQLVEAHSLISNEDGMKSPIEQTRARHFGKQDYSIISSFRSISSFISCGILFSIDRAAYTLDDAQTLINLLHKLKTSTPALPNAISELILGLDFSGNPFAPNKFGHFHAIWDKCRELNLSTSIHFGETPHEGDANDILRYYPHRVGHAVLIDKPMCDLIRFGPSCIQNLGVGSVPTTTPINTEQLTHKIGVEVCLSSNRACKLHQSINTHPFLAWFNYNFHDLREKYIEEVVAKHPGVELKDVPGLDEETIFQNTKDKMVPITLCTDDSGVFSCSLVDEWAQLLRLRYFNHNLSDEELTTPITTNRHTNNPDGFFELPLKGCQKTPSSETIAFTITQPPSQSKLTDFARINRLARTGIPSIFQKQYIPLLETIFQRFCPS